MSRDCEHGLLARSCELCDPQTQVDELHDSFTCERCGHNVHHSEPRGDRFCEVEPGEGVEFCIFIICGRCSNEQNARFKDDRDRLRDEAWGVGYGRGYEDGQKNERAERDRLADGIREHRDHDFAADPTVSKAATFREMRKVNERLWALLDVAGDDHLCECGHTLQAVGPGGPYRCVMGCKYQAARDRQVKAGDDPPVPYRALEGSEGGEDAT